MKNLRQIFFLLLLSICCTATAALSSGYFRILSNAYEGRYITENISEHNLTTASLNETNYAQVWYLNVSGSNVTIKNALTDRYVQTNSAWSALYTTNTGTKQFTYAETDAIYTFTDGGLACIAQPLSPTMLCDGILMQTHPNGRLNQSPSINRIWPLRKPLLLKSRHRS